MDTSKGKNYVCIEMAKMNRRGSLPQTDRVADVILHLFMFTFPIRSAVNNKQAIWRYLI